MPYIYRERYIEGEARGINGVHASKSDDRKETRARPSGKAGEEAGCRGSSSGNLVIVSRCQSLSSFSSLCTSLYVVEA